MRKRILAPVCGMLMGLFVLAGCGGGGGSSSSAPPAIVSALTGRAVVPAGTPTRAVATDVPLPFATATLTDITAGLPGTTFATTQTSGQGTYQFAGLAISHNYFLKITKTVTGPNGPITISLGSYVHIGGGGVAPSAVTFTTKDTDLSTTIALNYILQQIANGSVHPDDDLSDVEQNFANEFDSERNAGTAPDIDLSKDCGDPHSFSGETHQIVTRGLKSGTYFHSNRSSSNTVFNLLFNKDTHQIAFVLCLLDSAGDFFDADYFIGSTDAQGAFTGTTKDGLYTVKGQIAAGSAFGTWAAVDGSSKGAWVTQRKENDNAYTAKGYVGSFSKNGRDGDEGKWFLFVNAGGKALMFAHDEAFAQRSHLLKTAVITGTVNGAGHVSGGMVFPAIAGSVTGGDPTQGGTVTGSGSGNAAGHTGNGTGSVTGSISGNSVSGTWSFSGLRDGNAFNASGNWGGIQL